MELFCSYYSNGEPCLQNPVRKVGTGLICPSHGTDVVWWSLQDAIQRLFARLAEIENES